MNQDSKEGGLSLTLRVGEFISINGGEFKIVYYYLNGKQIRLKLIGDRTKYQVDRSVYLEKKKYADT